MNKRTKIAELTANRNIISSYQEARLILRLDQSSARTLTLAREFFNPGAIYTKYISVYRRHVRINEPIYNGSEWNGSEQSVSALADTEYVN